MSEMEKLAKPTKAQRKVLRAMHVGTFIECKSQYPAICVSGKPNHYIRLDTFRALCRGSWVKETAAGSGRFERTNLGIRVVEKWRK